MESETPKQFSERIWCAYERALAATGSSPENLAPLNRVLSDAKAQGMTMIEALEYAAKR